MTEGKKNFSSCISVFLFASTLENKAVSQSCLAVLRQWECFFFFLPASALCQLRMVDEISKASVVLPDISVTLKALLPISLTFNQAVARNRKAKLAHTL